ncbi:MBL fold metallo-hydrolase [Bacillus tianshenii]|nr:MBL fold metallo-hydrolase [Bacillus tianshenii]
MMKEGLQQLTERIFYLPPDHETDRPILGAVSGKRATLIIDAGNSEAHANMLLRELERKKVAPIRWTVLTHWHWDHVFGLNAFNTISIAHVKTKKKLEWMKELAWTDEAIDKRVKSGEEIEICAEHIRKEFGHNRDITIKLPTLTFEKKLDIDLGGIHCVIEHIGGDHAEDHSVVYIPEEKVLFIADCTAQKMYAEKWHYTVGEASRIAKKLLQYDAKWFVYGHWKAQAREEFVLEMNRLQMFAELCEEHQGDRRKMIKAFEGKLNREISTEELEELIYFVQGYQKR